MAAVVVVPGGGSLAVTLLLFFPAKDLDDEDTPRGEDLEDGDHEDARVGGGGGNPQHRVDVAEPTGRHDNDVTYRHQGRPEVVQGADERAAHERAQHQADGCPVEHQQHRHPLAGNGPRDVGGDGREEGGDGNAEDYRPSEVDAAVHGI